MIDIEQTIKEELDRLAPHDGVRPDWSEVVRRVERPPRRPHRGIGVAIAAGVAILALALVAPWDDAPTLVDRALAAIGERPVLHVVIEHPTHAPELVRIDDGTPVPRVSRSEIWFDASRDLKKTIDALDGIVVEELLESPDGGFTRGGRVYTCSWIAAHPVEATKAGVSCNPSGENGTTPRDIPEEPATLDEALAGFVDGYASALDSGRAREVARGTIEGREVVWLELPAAARHAQRVALDASSYKPVLVESGDGQVSFRVRAIETIPFEQAYFAMPDREVTLRGGVGGNVHGTDDVVTDVAPAETPAALGGTAYWLGEEWGDFSLVATRRVELSIRLSADTGERRHATGVEFEYARAGGGSTFTLRETTTCLVRWGWSCSPRDPGEPGTMATELIPRLRIGEVYVALWGTAAGGSTTPLEIARALEPVTP